MITLPERIKSDSEKNRKMLEQFGIDIRVASPGIIQSFDSDKKTAVIQLAIREKINLDGNLSWEEIPLLYDVPVAIIRGGGYMVEFEPAFGDECLVIFGDNCFDAWWQSGGVQNQIDKRRHDLSDGFAICGVTSLPRKFASGGPGIRLRNEAGDAFLEIKGSAINIKNTTVNIESSQVTIAGKDFLTHKHTGVEPGGGSTGGVA